MQTFVSWLSTGAKVDIGMRRGVGGLASCTRLGVLIDRA